MSRKGSTYTGRLGFKPRTLEPGRKYRNPVMIQQPVRNQFKPALLTHQITEWSPCYSPRWAGFWGCVSGSRPSPRRARCCAWRSRESAVEGGHVDHVPCSGAECWERIATASLSQQCSLNPTMWYIKVTSQSETLIHPRGKDCVCVCVCVCKLGLTFV